MEERIESTGSPARNGSNGSVIAIAVGAVLLMAIAVGIFLFGNAADNDPAGALSSEQSLPDSFGSVPAEVRFMERSGREMQLGELRGTPWVASFIFTRCGGTCPMMSKSMSALQDSLRGIGDVRLASFSVDPEYDTPERLNEYAASYRADTTRWFFFTTGSDSTIRTVAREVFKIGVQEGGTEVEPIVHSTKFVLIDAEGEIRGYFDGMNAEGRAELLRTLRTLLRSEAI